MGMDQRLATARSDDAVTSARHRFRGRTFGAVVLGCLVGSGCDGDSPAAAPPTATAATSAAAARSAAASTATTASAAARDEKPNGSPRIVQLEAGPGSSFAVYSDGTVKGWGTNQYGVLALGKDPQPRLTPETIPELKDVEQLHAGRFHVCALGRDGKVRCWGRNFSGCLGHGGLDSRRAPTLVVGLDDVRQIALHQDASCAVRKDGSVWCWGFSAYGRTLVAPKGAAYEEVHRRPTRIAEAPAAQSLAMGSANQCVVTEDGTVACWGWITGGRCPDYHEDPCIARTPRPLDEVTDVAELVMAGHLCARHRSGSVSCWGRGDYGQLGDGRFGRDYVQVKPVPLPDLTDVVTLDAGAEHTCAVRASGTLVCWGHNDSGQLGVGDKKLRAKPTAVLGLKNVVAVSAGVVHTCALQKDGRVFCWGGNRTGQLGNSQSAWSAMSLEPTEVKFGESTD